MNTVRSAKREDLALLVQLIQDLAVYERLRDHCFATEAGLEKALFGERPCAEAIVGEVDGVAQGFALFFTNFSTFLCQPGIYLEDLFVRPAARGKGLGKMLISHLAGLAVARGCGRLEWSVLDWNTPAIEFYKSLGAMPMDDWTIFRLTGPALKAFGG